jgi:hypothetical protein
MKGRSLEIAARERRNRAILWRTKAAFVLLCSKGHAKTWHAITFYFYFNH